MSYVDGFLLAVPTANREEYRQMALKGAEFFKKLGATKFVECWGEDVPDGKVTSFPMSVKLQPGETVVFSWIVWPSKEVRAKGHAAMHDESQTAEWMKNMPFDGMRMMFGGFEPIVDLSFD